MSLLMQENHWQEIYSSTLPDTPIRDLVIKNDDVVLGTHGRGFWILDDIGPLRQMKADYFDKEFSRISAYRMPSEVFMMPRFNIISKTKQIP